MLRTCRYNNNITIFHLILISINNAFAFSTFESEKWIILGVFFPNIFPPFFLSF